MAPIKSVETFKRSTRFLLLASGLLIGFNQSPILGLASPLPDDSVYQVQSLWLDQEGKKEKLEVLAGKPTVVSMVYLSCAHTCPLTLAKMRAVETLAKARKLKLNYVMISFDPTRDTAEKLANYAKKNELTAPSWKLITTPNESDLRELSGLLDYKFKRLPDGEFEHSLALLLLSEKGEVLSRIEGMRMKPEELLDALKAQRKK